MVMQFSGNGSVKAGLRRTLRFLAGRLSPLVVLAAFLAVQAVPLWQDSPCAASPTAHRCACGSEDHETSDCCCRAETHASPLSHCSWKAIPCGAEEPTSLDSAFAGKPIFAEECGNLRPVDGLALRVRSLDRIALGAELAPPIPPPRLPAAA